MANDHPGQADCEVLIIGAGPTGLMAANLLKRSGVDVRIVEQRAQLSRESRAFAIQARTLELFQHIGLVDKLLDRGVINASVEFYVGGRHAGSLNFDGTEQPDTPYPFIFLLPQSQTEEILLQDLAAQGVEVERGIEISGIDQDRDSAVSQGRTEDRREVLVRSGYVLGCDGAHSIARKSQGFSFEGAQYPQTFLLADCRVIWPADSKRGGAG